MILRWLLIVGGSILAALMAVPAWADAILRPAVVVTSDQVKLGDLFDGIGDKAGTFVAHAPPPGRKAVVDADWLQHVAMLNGLDWKTDDPFLEVVIERAGVTIPRERIQQEVLAALAAQGVSSEAQVELLGQDLQMTVPADVTPTIAIKDMVYDPGSKHFTATVEAPAGAPNPTRLTIAGAVYDVEDVPTLAHPVAHGEVIAARDLAFLHMRADKVRHDVILDVDQIIGLTPKSAMRGGQPLTLADLQHPTAIERNALVTVVLRQGAMTLSIEGRANEPGSVGDIIKVTNTRSNQVIPARVEGPNLVSVGIGVAPVSGIAMAN